MMQSRKLTRDIRAVGAMTLMALALAGCGLRGNLEYPNETGSTEKAAPTNTATAESGQGKPEGAAPKPHKGFILDGLIR